MGIRIYYHTAWDSSFKKLTYFRTGLQIYWTTEVLIGVKYIGKIFSFGDVFNVIKKTLVTVWF